MSITDLTTVANQIKKKWSPNFVPSLQEDTLLAGLVNREYDGEMQEQMDTVYISRTSNITGSNKSTSDATINEIEDEELQLNRIALQANQLASASVKITSLADLQSQLQSQKSDIRKKLFEAVQRQINDYLYSIVSPSTSAPDHELGSITNMSAAQIRAIRLLASQAKWDKMGGWYGLLDPSYYGDVLADSTLNDRDYGADDVPTIGGQVVRERYGFKLLEDNSRSTDYGLFFHPDFMHLAVQKMPTIKLSDLHAVGQRGYRLTMDVVYGAVIGHEGSVKHIRVQGS